MRVVNFEVKTTGGLKKNGHFHYANFSRALEYVPEPTRKVNTMDPNSFSLMKTMANQSNDLGSFLTWCEAAHFSFQSFSNVIITKVGFSQVPSSWLSTRAWGKVPTVEAKSSQSRINPAESRVPELNRVPDCDFYFQSRFLTKPYLDVYNTLILDCEVLTKIADWILNWFLFLVCTGSSHVEA